MAVGDITESEARAMVSDQQLMLRFQNGAADAFSELFHRYREPIYGFFRRRLNDAARAEELAQETFVAVLRGVSRYEPRALFRTYLYGIALNLLAAERREAGREVSGEQAPDPATAGDPDAALWVRQAIAQLGAGEREILLLREYEQLSYEEIAQVLRLPVSNVRTRLFRARVALKELLVPRRNAARE